MLKYIAYVCIFILFSLSGYAYFVDGGVKKIILKTSMRMHRLLIVISVHKQELYMTLKSQLQ